MHFQKVTCLESSYLEFELLLAKFQNSDYRAVILIRHFKESHQTYNNIKYEEL